MKKLLITFLLTLTLGVSQSQVSFFVSPDLYMKMSFNSNAFSDWDSKTVKVSNRFTYENKSYVLSNPFRIGISLGMRFKKKNEIILGYYEYEVSEKNRLRFPTYSVEFNEITPNKTRSRSVSDQKRLFILFNYILVKNENKTTLSIMPSLSFMKRAGPRYTERGGVFSSSALLPNSYRLEYTNSDFTMSKYALAYGIGIGSDLYLRGKYLFSTSLQFSYSRNYLSLDQTRVKLINLNTQEETNYIFDSYNWASGLYLTFTKKIKLFPRKKKKNKNKNS